MNGQSYYEKNKDLIKLRTRLTYERKKLDAFIKKYKSESDMTKKDIYKNKIEYYEKLINKTKQEIDQSEEKKIENDIKYYKNKIIELENKKNKK